MATNDIFADAPEGGIAETNKQLGQSALADLAARGDKTAKKELKLEFGSKVASDAIDASLMRLATGALTNKNQKAELKNLVNPKKFANLYAQARDKKGTDLAVKAAGGDAAAKKELKALYPGKSKTAMDMIEKAKPAAEASKEFDDPLGMTRPGEAGYSGESGVTGIGNGGGGSSSPWSQFKSQVTTGVDGALDSSTNSINTALKTVKGDVSGATTGAMNIPVDQWIGDVISKFGDSSGMPIIGDYQGLSSLSHNGELGEPHRVRNLLDLSGVDAMKDRATQVGPSAWANMATEQQRREESGLMDNAARQQMGAEANARAQLGMKGGLRSGAAERLASSGANNLALAGQGVRQQGALERGNIGIQDEMQKMDLLKQLPGAQLGAAQYGSAVDTTNIANKMGVGQYNINNQIRDLEGRNAQNQFLYGEEMKTKGANATANAIASSGKK